MTDIMEFNKFKRIELMNKIIQSNGKYRLFCLDVDDVIYNIDPKMQEILEKIDHRATKKYREATARETSEDSLNEIKKSFCILDAILEEREFIEEDEKTEKIKKNVYPKIDYNSLYVTENLFPGVVDYINYMLGYREKNDFFIFLSHRNPEREGIIKTNALYELFPDIDLVVTIPYHIEPGSKVVNDKGLAIKQILGLDNLDNCLLIDNSKSNGKDFRKSGGIDIRFLPEGFQENHTLADHVSKLATLDPYKIAFIISYVKYAREHPEYVTELDKPIKVKRIG